LTVLWACAAGRRSEADSQPAASDRRTFDIVDELKGIARAQPREKLGGETRLSRRDRAEQLVILAVPHARGRKARCYSRIRASG